MALEFFTERGVSALTESGDSTASIPSGPTVRCCCGNEACAYLVQNRSALESLEHDVRTAARLGQALLIRHETYVADSEREREIMVARIESLESEKVLLETKNANIIEENRSLLDQLEALNNAVVQSDGQVASLQATLHSAQQELQKLSQLASKMERLEHQLLDFEREQETWQSSMEAKEENEKSALTRWHEAERRLGVLQEQIERIEREAREERERHMEVVSRMERRHVVEKELDVAADRLKRAASAKDPLGAGDGGGSNVVSHFVKDILQDNANLQMGIVELREMLQNSNDEVETLRKQLLEHQPLHRPSDLDDALYSPELARRQSLKEELSRASSQELHVHHHYHAPPAPRQAPTIRRPKKKRYGSLTASHFGPSTSGRSTPRSSVSYGTSSAATILQQTAVSLPQSVPSSVKRYSAQSTATILSSSGPSSPQSTTYRGSSVFDRVFSDAGQESSRPTTPDTEDPCSPMIWPVKSKRATAWRNVSAPAGHQRNNSSIDSMLSISVDQVIFADEQQSPTEHDAIPEEDEALSMPEEASSRGISPLSDKLVDPIIESRPLYRPLLRRAASHESLVSISGMDIHTLKSRPSQLLLGVSRLEPQASISSMHAHAARPAAQLSRPTNSSHSLLSGMAADRREAGRPSLGSQVGGWMLGRWGITPAPSTQNVVKPSKPPSIASSSTSSQPPANLDVQAPSKKPKLRTPGINQLGPIPGLGPETRPAMRAPLVVKEIDVEGLRLALEG